MDFETATAHFQKIFKSLNDEDIQQFKQFVISEFINHDKSDEKFLETLEINRKLDEIVDNLRCSLPIHGLADSETYTLPDHPDYKDHTEENTIHIDSFLYNDDDIEDLIENGYLDRYYCSDCGSRNVKSLNFVRHSLPRNVLGWIMDELPDLTDKVFVDLGSRVASTLYVAHLMTKAKRIIGFEPVNDIYQLCNSVLKDHNMLDRVKLINDSIENRIDILNEADVIFIKNDFEFMLSNKEISNIWELIFKNTTKKGTLIITSPSLEESLEKYGINVNLSEWVEEVKLNYPVSSCGHDDEEDDHHCCHEDDEYISLTHSFHLYKVI